MKRGLTGRYEITSVAGEQIRAFVPYSLPPNPPLDLGDTRQLVLERALLALGRLDSISTLLPDPHLFLYCYVRREAVVSSQIEGTQSSLSDLLLFELEEVPGVPLDDVVEVSNYVAALEHGLARLREGFPLSNRLIREMHEKLLSRGRGNEKSPGEFRRSQNWIDGTRPGTAQRPGAHSQAGQWERPRDHPLCTLYSLRPDVPLVNFRKFERQRKHVFNDHITCRRAHFS